MEEKAEVSSTQISHQTNRLSSCTGFTLLEVIIVVVIIAAILVVVSTKLSGRPGELKSAVRKLSTLSRNIQSQARLQNATYRLVIFMPNEDENKKDAYLYWVEKSSGTVLNNYDPDEPPPAPNSEEEKKYQEENPSSFTPDTKLMKKPQTLPGKLIFESIELKSIKEPITEGIVYIHYLPSGFTDEAAIHLKNGERLRWTLALDSLTGRMDIYDEHIKLEDLRAE